MKLASRAFFDPAEDEAPHIEIERLRAHGAGLIALTGGPDGPDRQSALREGQKEVALERLKAAGEDFRRPALRRDPAPRPQARDRDRAGAARAGLRAGAADRRHQRGLFRRPRRLRGARRAAVHRRGHLRHRGQPAPAVARAFLQDRRADGGAVRRPAGGAGQHHRDRQALRLPSHRPQADPAPLRRRGTGHQRGGAAGAGDGRAAPPGRGRPGGSALPPRRWRRGSRPTTTRSGWPSRSA